MNPVLRVFGALLRAPLAALMNVQKAGDCLAQNLMKLNMMIVAAGGFILLASGAETQSRNTGEYATHPDGGIIYNPLSRDALAAGALERFKHVSKKAGTCTLNGVRLKYEVPTSADAYDVVPVQYTIENTTGDVRPIAVECTAFEEQTRTASRPLFDMSLPGDLSVRIEYLGCVCADSAGSRPLLDPRAPKPHMGAYPGWICDPLTRSGIIRKANHVWFNFRYTVTGNTILDAEGFNGVQTEAQLYKQEPNGQYKRVAGTINQWERNWNYQYPGEACEQSVLFWYPDNALGPKYNYGGLPPGNYKVRFNLEQKSYQRWSQWGNVWGGEPFAHLDVYLTVVEGKVDSVEPRCEQVTCKSATGGNFPEYLHSFEEFMTGFEWFRNRVVAEHSTVYVQVAPWTKQLVVKLIRGAPLEIATAVIPLEVSSANIALKYNPQNPFVVQRQGREEPAILAQLMPSMRYNLQLGPQPDKLLEDMLKEAIACGVNLYCSESGGYALDDFFRTPQTHDPLGESMKFFHGLLKKYGVPSLGFGIYPAGGAAKFGGKLLEPPVSAAADMGHDGAKHFAYADWSRIWAAIALYNYRVWGDNWYRTKDGKLIIDVEDTVGWMREDLHIRYPVGSKNIADFRDWCRRKYGTISHLNKAWLSDFPRFEDIDPEAGQSVGPFNHKWEYHKKTNPVFYEWSPALKDFDLFLTEARCVRYKEIMDIVRKTIPEAIFDLRTEGSNFIIPDRTQLSDSPHEAHVRNSASRNAELGEVLSGYKDIVGFYSDYTTLPFTPEEWRKLTRLSVAQGIRPMPLPHLARTRDMAVQQRYGADYTSHYNLNHPAKATMVFRLQALFPVMKAIYEEGGCCGVIWSDFLCDAFVTETQKKELKILRNAMDNMREKQKTKAQVAKP